MFAPTMLIRGASMALILVGAVVGLALAAAPPAKVQRYGSVIGVRPEKVETYKKLHAAVWPGVLKMIKECNIQNYSIYLKEVEPGKFYLFSYFEYTGTTSRPTWPRWRPTPPRRSGGRNATPASSRFRRPARASGGPDGRGLPHRLRPGLAISRRPPSHPRWTSD